jgi:Ca2+-binding RTX toxin-like protein
MATFNISNTAGFGFNMSGTDSTGWSFVTDDPSISEVLVYDDGSTAIWDVYGSTYVDQFGINYWTDSYNILVTDIAYSDNGYFVLTIEGLNLWTTSADLQANAWFVNLNADFDTFYGNDYVDFIRGGDGWDDIYGYAGDDTLYGDAGSDWLEGGSGNDAMYGGIGDDIFVVDSAFDFVGEALGEGSDKVLTYLNSYTLGSNVETLTFVGAGNCRFRQQPRKRDSRLLRQ